MMWMRLGEKRLRGKPVYVLDATPVIHFAKIGKLELVSGVCDAVLVGEVYREVATGDYPDALLVRDLVDGGVLRVYEVVDRDIVDALLRFPGVHLGEAETLAASKFLGGLAVVDDAEARAVAEVYGIDAAPGTLFLLFKLLSSGVVGVEEAEEMLVSLVNHGLYLDPRTLLRAKMRLKEHATRK